jgi:hypothetical protein
LEGYQAHRLQPVTKISSDCQQALDCFFIKRFPPQLKKKDTVIKYSQLLLHLADQRLVSRILGVSRKCQRSKAVNARRSPLQGFQAVDDVQENFRSISGVSCGRCASTMPFSIIKRRLELRHLGLEKRHKFRLSVNGS